MDYLFDTKSVNLLCGEVSRRVKPGNNFKQFTPTITPTIAPTTNTNDHMKSTELRG